MTGEDPRIVANRRAVHAAALTVLADEGVAGLGVERLAEVSGVSRSTIYRRWPDLQLLVIAAFDDVVHEKARAEVTLPSEASAALLAYLHDYARRLNDPVYATVVLAIADWARRDPAFARKHGRNFDQSRSVATRVVHAGRRAGTFRADLDVTQAVEDIVAPFLYRRLFLRRRISEADIRTLHRRLIDRFAPV